jgi:hypothetical protein
LDLKKEASLLGLLKTSKTHAATTARRRLILLAFFQVTSKFQKGRLTEIWIKFQMDERCGFRKRRRSLKIFGGGPRAATDARRLDDSSRTWRAGALKESRSDPENHARILHPNAIQLEAKEVDGKSLLAMRRYHCAIHAFGIRRVV